jgi:TP901 family phage tail tape measure protein
MSLLSSAKGIESEKVRKAVLEGVTQAYRQQLEQLRELRKVEEAKPQRMQERSAREIERQSTAIRKTRQFLKDLAIQYEATAKSATELAGSSGAVSERFTSFFSKMVTGANKTKDFAQSLRATSSAEQELSQQIKRSITDVNLQANALSALADEADKARAAIAAQEAAYKRTQDTKRLNQEVRQTLAGANTTDLTSLNTSIANLQRLKLEMQNLGVSTDNVDAAIARLGKKIKSIESGNVEKATKTIAASANQFAKTLAKIKAIAQAFKEVENNSQQMKAAVGSVRNVVQTSFAAILTKAKATNDYSRALMKSRIQHKQLSEAIRANVSDQETQASMLRVLATEYKNLTNKIIEARRAKNEKGEKKFLEGRVQDIVAKASSADAAGLKKSIIAMKEVIENTEALGFSSAKARRALERMENRLKKMELDTYRRRVENVTRTLRNFTSGINQTGEQIRRVSFIFRDIGRQMMTIARTSVRYISPIVKDYMKFEQSVTDVLAVTGDLNSNLTKTDIVASGLGKTILDLAGQFVFSAEEIANVAKELALAGFSLEQIEGSLRSVITLASATGSDLSTAAKIVTSTMAVFGLEASQTARVADVFTATVTNAKTNLNQLAEAFKIVAPVAAGSGQSIEQTAAALGTLANAGLTGSIAGTGLARILTQLSEKGRGLDSVLVQLGSSFDALDPEKRTFGQIIAEFERLRLSTPTLLAMFDLRAFRALNAILAQGSNKLGNFAEQLARSSRVAESISAARLNTLAGAVQLLSDAFTSLKVTLGNLLGEEIREFVLFLKGAVVLFKGFVEANKEALQPFFRFVLAVVGVLGTLGTSLFTAGSSAAFFAAPLISLGAILASVTSIVTFATGIMTSFGVAMAAAAKVAIAITAAIALPFFAFAAAVVASLLAVTISIANFSKKWADFFIKVGGVFTDVYNRVLLPIYTGFVKNLEVIEKATDNLLVSLGKVSDGIRGGVATGNWESFGEFLADLVAEIINLTAAIINDLVPAIQLLTQAMTQSASKSQKFFEYMKLGFFALRALLLLTLSPLSLFMATWLEAALRIVKSFTGTKREADDAAKKILDLTEKFQQQANTLAGVTIEAEKYARALGSISNTLKNLSSVKPVEFEQLIKLAEDGMLDKQKRGELVGAIDNQIKGMRAVIAEYETAVAAGMEPTPDSVRAYKAALKRIEELEKTKETINKVAAEVDRLGSFISGDVDTNVKKITEAITQEAERVKELDRIATEISTNWMRQSAGAVIDPQEIARLQQELSNLGITVDINVANPMQALQAAISGPLQDAIEESGVFVNQLDSVLQIIDEISGADISDPETWRRVAASFDKINKASQRIAEELTEATNKREELAKKLDQEAMNAHQKRMAEIAEEFEEREKIIAAERELLMLKKEALERERRSRLAKGEDVAKLDDEITAVNDLLRPEMHEGNDTGVLTKLQQKAAEARDRLNKELAEQEREARAKTQDVIDNMRLEVEEDINERIIIRERLAERARAASLKAALQELEDNVDEQLKPEELARLRRELEKANQDALTLEKQKIREEEMKEQNKDMVKAAEKRTDLEFEIVGQLAKQVKSMQEMIELTKFLDFLEARKDRRSMIAVRELIRERRKLAQLEARAAGGDRIAQGALEGQRDIVNLMAGRVVRNKQQAGVGVGPAGNLFNLDAMIAGFNAALNKFVQDLEKNPLTIAVVLDLNNALENFLDKLQDNPIILPARFDMGMLKEDLTELFRRFNMDGTVPKWPKIDPNLGASTNKGGTMTHNDNRRIIVNLARADNGLENMLGRMYNG